MQPKFPTIDSNSKNIWHVGKLANISLFSFLLLGKSFTGENFLTEQEANLIRSEGYKRPARGQNKVCNVLLLHFLMLIMIIYVCHSGSV